MMSLTFGLFTQVSGSGPLGPLVLFINIYAVKIYASGFLGFTPKDTHPSTSNALSITGKPETSEDVYSLDTHYR